MVLTLFFSARCEEEGEEGEGGGIARDGQKRRRGRGDHMGGFPPDWKRDGNSTKIYNQQERAMTRVQSTHINSQK